MKKIFYEAEIRDVIPPLLQRHKRVQAIFVTYNAVRDIPTGPYETGTPDLRIEVENGNRQISIGELAFGALAVSSQNADSSRKYVELRHTQATEALAQTTHPAKIQDFEGAHDLLVMYLGFSCFQPSIQRTREFRRVRPQATILGVACDCIRVEELQPPLTDGTLTAAIITDHCGGRDAMRTIFDTVLNHYRI